MGGLFQVVSIIASAVSTAAILAWWLRGKFEGIEKKFDRRFQAIEERFQAIEQRLDRLQERVDRIWSFWKGLLDLTGTLINLFVKHVKTLEEDERGSLLRPYFKLVGASEATGAARNPLSPEEKARLQYYIAKGKRGEWFKREEAQDFVQIVEKLEKERPGDESLWPLIAVAAFITGLYLLGRETKVE